MADVKIENIVKHYGKSTALDGVSLTLRSGTLTAVLGPSGCGKTTMLRILAGFLPVDSGRVLFGDDDVTQLAPQKRGAALVFQNYALWPHMSVYDNIAYGLRLKKQSKDEIDRRVRDMTALVGLDPEMLAKGRKPTQLSGGQQQRVALARALVVEPSLFLLDEPLSNLDAKVRARLRVYIREIQQKVGITALYVTHDQEEALSIADTIVVMSKGRIMQIGTPEDIYHRPANLFVADFIGDSTVLKGEWIATDTVMLSGNRITGIPIRTENGVNASVGGEVAILLRAGDIKLYPGEDDMEDNPQLLCIPAYAESAMFTGAQYKHVVRFGGSTLFADWEENYSGRKVHVVVPKEKVIIFARGGHVANHGPVAEHDAMH